MRLLPATTSPSRATNSGPRCRPDGSASIEPGLGTALPATATGTFDELLQALSRLGRHRQARRSMSCRSRAADSSSPPATMNHDERALDVGIVSTVNPQSQLVLYAGSGHQNGAGQIPSPPINPRSGTRSTIPSVVSSSFSSYQHVSPGSPFYFAQQQLFIDAALRGITVVNAAGDGGSGEEYPNGLTNSNHACRAPTAWSRGRLAQHGRHRRGRQDPEEDFREGDGRPSCHDLATGRAAG